MNKTKWLEKAEVLGKFGRFNKNRIRMKDAYK